MGSGPKISKVQLTLRWGLKLKSRDIGYHVGKARRLQGLVQRPKARWLNGLINRSVHDETREKGECSCISGQRLIVPHTRSRWVLISIFRYLSSTYNAKLLHNMAFNSNATIEARIREDCDAIHDGWYTNCTQAARAYDVPIRRLQRQWNGIASKSTRASTNKAPTKGQEGAIREYIGRLDRINICARPKMIVGAANYLICFENRVVGHQWLKRFLEQNHKYHIQKQKLLEAERKYSHSVYDMNNYFENIERVIREKEITEFDV